MNTVNEDKSNNNLDGVTLSLGNPRVSRKADKQRGIKDRLKEQGEEDTMIYHKQGIKKAH